MPKTYFTLLSLSDSDGTILFDLKVVCASLFPSFCPYNSHRFDSFVYWIFLFLLFRISIFHNIRDSERRSYFLDLNPLRNLQRKCLRWHNGVNGISAKCLPLSPFAATSQSRRGLKARRGRFKHVFSSNRKCLLDIFFAVLSFPPEVLKSFAILRIIDIINIDIILPTIASPGTRQ